MPTPSPLKWMTDRRNRLAGELVRVDSLLVKLRSRRRGLRQAIADLDRTCALFDASRSVALRRPLRGTVEHYRNGPGVLEGIVRVLSDSGRQAMTTQAVALEVAALNGLTFDGAEHWRRWLRGSLRRRLAELATKGHIEAVHDRARRDGLASGQWRLTREGVGSLAALRKQAAHLGVVVHRDGTGSR